MFLTEDDIDIWRHFQTGESVASISRQIELSPDSVLRIILWVDCQIANSSRFFRIVLNEYDGSVEDSIYLKPKIPPVNKLEKWLRN